MHTSRGASRPPSITRSERAANYLTNERLRIRSTLNLAAKRRSIRIHLELEECTLFVSRAVLRGRARRVESFAPLLQ